MKDHTMAHAAPGADTIEPSGATDDIRYVLNRPAPSAAAGGDPAGTVDGTLSTPIPAPIDAAGDAAEFADHPDATGGLADCVINNADDQLRDATDSTVRGGQVGQESKRGAY